MASHARFPRIAPFAMALCAMAAGSQMIAPPAFAQAQNQPVFQTVPAQLTYADLVELALASDQVIRVEIDDQTNVPPERAPGLAAGQARLYLEAVTRSLLAGSGPVGESLSFLADRPLTASGKRPKLKRETFLIFAKRVSGQPGMVQLAGPKAMQAFTPELEARVRHVLTQLVQGDQPPLLTGVREVMSVQGNLTGESETQIFFETQTGEPVSLTVLRRPGLRAQWGASWTDIVDQSARPPEPQTLQWYALACHLPPQLPADAFLQPDAESRERARADYALVLDQIGRCERS